MSWNASSGYFSLMSHCSDSPDLLLLTVAFMVSKCVTTVPVSILILSLGYQRWQRQCSFQSTSHADIFTYHAAAFGLLFGFAVISFCCGMYTGVFGLFMVGVYASSVVFPAEILLHIMTCVERYLAVVHPVIYLGLKQTGGARIRNISIGCVWMISFGWMGNIANSYPVIPFTAHFCLLATSFGIISFCSLSVLCVLIRQRPGEAGRLRERADKSKKKSFYTITAILCVLVMYFMAAIVSLAVKNSYLLDERVGCLILMVAQWFGFPSSLVLPSLFLQRAKERLCCFCSKR